MFNNVFNCCGINSEDFSLKQILNYEGVLSDSPKEISGKLFYTEIALEEIEILIRKIRKYWCHIQNSVVAESTVSSVESSRKVINKCFQAILDCMQTCDNILIRERYTLVLYQQVKSLESLILPIFNLEQNIYLKIVGSLRNRNRNQIYHYFHSYQEIHYYLLLIYRICDKRDDVKERITQVMKELSLLSKSIKTTTSFICDCNKYFWLFMQVLCERYLSEDSFWLLFNKALENSDGEFTLSLLKDIAQLQTVGVNGEEVGLSCHRIKPNFILLENSFKSVVTNADSRKSILPILRFIEPIICNLWLKWGKIEIYQTLWECFSKRLNTSSPNNITSELPELMSLLDTILWTPNDCQGDFEMFLSMLNKHLNQHSHHWSKMKGRIYSQLGPNKLKDLNTIGTFNVLLMFLALTKFNFDELSRKFLSIVGNLQVEKKQTRLTWSLYSALIMYFIKENRDIEGIISPFLKMLEEASIDNNSFHLIKAFVIELELVIKTSTNFQLHQWLLINSWIHKYMNSCQYQDVVTLLTFLSNTIDKLTLENAWSDWEQTFKDFVYPALKYSRNMPEISGTVAGKIVILSPTLLTDAFTFFNSEAVTPKISANFLCILLDNYPESFYLSTEQETVALQTWLKLSLLTRENNEEFTQNITKLGVIPEYIKTRIFSTDDPLFTFIECLGDKEQIKSRPVVNLCDLFFNKAERWVSKYFTHPESEVIVLRIYNCLVLAFCKIATLLYDKQRADCPFARLLTVILLPTEVVTGKSLNSFILHGIRKTWRAFFEIIIKLHDSGDPFMERMLREMVVRYLPLFTGSDSPIIQSLANPALVGILLEKISEGFLKQPIKQSESNVFKTLKMINDFVNSKTTIVSLRMVVNKCLYGLFEVMMFHSQRNMASTIVKSIVLSQFFDDVKSDFQDVIVSITEKHLAFNTPNYFQLLGNLSKLTPSTINSVISRIKQCICNVERMRGVGYDKTLRLSLERIEVTLPK